MPPQRKKIKNEKKKIKKNFKKMYKSGRPVRVVPGVRTGFHTGSRPGPRFSPGPARFKMQTGSGVRICVTRGIEPEGRDHIWQGVGVTREEETSSPGPIR